MSKVILRGQVYTCDLGGVEKGSNVQAGKRPVLVVQNNYGNRYSPTVLVAPITTNLTAMPTH